MRHFNETLDGRVKPGHDKGDGVDFFTRFFAGMNAWRFNSKRMRSEDTEAAPGGAQVRRPHGRERSRGRELRRCSKSLHQGDKIAVLAEESGIRVPRGLKYGAVCRVAQTQIAQ